MTWGFQPLPAAGAQVASRQLGGSALTCGTGTLRVDKTLALAATSTAITGGQTAPTPSHTVPLASFNDPVNTRIVGAQGTLGVVIDDEVQLNGVSSTVSDGTVTPSHSVPLVGSASTSALQSFAAIENKVSLDPGQVITSGHGIVVQEGPPVTVHINAGEMEMLGAVGSVLPTQILTGHASTGAAGTMVPSHDVPLTGEGFTSAVGSVVPSQDIEDTYITSQIGTLVHEEAFALTGIAITSVQGSAGASFDITLAMTGAESISAAGTLALTLEIPLSGTAITGEQDNSGFGLPVIRDLVGEGFTAVAGNVFLNNDREYPLVGESITSAQNAFAAVLINVPVNGQTIFSEQFLYYTEAALEGMAIESGQGRMGEGKKNDAGKPPKDKKPKKVKVEIDGEIFEVKSIEEGEALYRQVLELAAEKAKADADAQVAAALTAKSDAKVKLAVPSIKGNKKLAEEVAAIYTQATIDAQVLLEVSRKRQVDEEEALVLLLLN